MPQQPEYISLLNDVRLQEERAGIWLKAWSEKTANPELSQCLALVAEREASHGAIFERRIRELGFAGSDNEDPLFAERLRVASSEMPYAEKIAWMRAAQSGQPKPTVRDRYQAAIDDESVDALTRSLLRWFTDVENDSVAQMSEVYARVEQGA